MGKKLNTFVTVHDEDFTAHTFGPSDKLPGWAKKAITNPNVWAEDNSYTSDDEDDVEGGQNPPAGGAAGSNGAAELTPPPTGGAGSGADAWRAYAAAAAKKAGLQIEIPAEANRADIIEALKGADIPVE